MKAFLNILEKLNKKVDSNDGIGLQKPSLDSLPYACHYSPETILTKNGELLQIIKIEDFHSDHDIRSEIRSSIMKNIKGKDFALNIHTVRHKGNVSIPWNEDLTTGFAYDLHKSWQDQKRSKVEYVSEIYITLIIRGLNNRTNLTNFVANLSSSYVRNKHSTYLAKKYELLNTTINKVKEDLQCFNPMKLTVDNDNQSELLGFLHFLVTLLSDNSGKMPLPMQDLSGCLLNNIKKAVGFNIFEVVYNSVKRFASVLAVKRYREVNPSLLSQAMQIKREFIIAEAIDFDDNPAQSKKVERQKYLLNVSQNTDLYNMIKLNDFADTEKCVNHYINIVPISDNIKELESCIRDFTDMLYEFGLSIFRHDISLEDAFLSIMPANFAFKTLSYYTLTNNIGGFALLHALNSGQIKCEQWGYAVTLFWSVYNTPYFFNFHAGESGHTIMMGPVGSGKTILQNFMISESKKIGTRVFIIDNKLKSKVFINALEGEYKEVGLDSANLPCNPFQEKNDKEFLYSLIAKIIGKEIEEEKVAAVVDKLMLLSEEERNFNALYDILSDLEFSAKKWFLQEQYMSLLLQEEESNFWESGSIGLNFCRLPDDLVIVCIFAILKKIESILDGGPALIVLDEAWKISRVFDDSVVLDNFLKRMNELNCVVIFTCSEVEAAISSQFTVDLLGAQISTQIFMPGNIAHRGYLKPFGLTRVDLFMINSLQSHNRHFFLKQGGKSIVLKLDVSDLPEMRVLSSDPESIKYMEKSMTEVNDKNEDSWLPIFYEKCQKEKIKQ